MNKLLLLGTFFIFQATSLMAQQNTSKDTVPDAWKNVPPAPPPPPDSIKPKSVFNYVEQMPVLSVDMGTYLSEHLHYPKYARNHDIEGRLIVKFVVNEDGSVSDVYIVKGIGESCDEEAKRVVTAMPKWIPGRQNGKAVKVYFTLPIVFKLEDRKKRQH